MTTATHALPDAEARRIIATALDETLLVEAAAGTGKTTELVGRIVRIIADDRAKVGEIVAVTFTEKAAGELKLRLRERLDTERSEAQQDPERRARLDEALKQLEEAHVSTIHGFCADLLRERPVEAGIDPLFEVLTEPASARLFDEAFGRWLQEQLADPPEGIRRALRRSTFSGDNGPVDRLRSAAWELAQWRDFTAPWTREPFDRRSEMSRLITSLHEFADLTRNPQSRNDPLHTGTEPARRLSDEISVHQGFGDGIAVALMDQWEAALVDLSRDRLLATVRQGRGTAFSDRVPRQQVLQALADLRARLDQFRMVADADLAALLQGELQGAIRRYESTKAAAGALDFLDLLLGARNLIRDNPDVRRGFQQRFKRIFVDEFQDTDPLQAEILLLLAADDDRETNWRRAKPAAGRLFLVGDPKQSIYRFRRADVAVYRDVCRQLESQGATIVRLNTSFRSVPAIQTCVNTAFAPIMTGDDLTLQADYVPLAPYRPAIADQPALVALPVPAPYAKRYISAASIEKSLPDATGALVDWIVRQSGWTVTERSGTAPVPVAAKHVCLLFRRFISYQTDVTRAYVDALESRGLPHVLVGGRAFHEREEVEAIRAAFAAIERPDDELSIFATLRGPFFAIGDEELLEWTSTFGRSTGDGFRRHVFHPFRVPAEFASAATPVLDRLRPIASALSLLRRLHMRRNYVPVAETLHELLNSTRAHVGFALRPGGEQALANVLHVAELARQYRARWRYLVSRLCRRVAYRRGKRAGCRGTAPRGRQRRRPDDDGPQSQGPRIPHRHPRGPDLQIVASRGRTVDRPGEQPLRAETRRVGADGSPSARPRGISKGSRRSRAARLRCGHTRARRAGGSGHRRRGIRGRMAESADARGVPGGGGQTQSATGRPMSRLPVEGFGHESSGRRPGAPVHRCTWGVSFRGLERARMRGLGSERGSGPRER